MKLSRSLVVAALAGASLPVLMAQQIDATAQQNASASAAGVRANQSANADANANVNHGHADVGAPSSADSSTATHHTSAASSSDNSANTSGDFRPVTGQLESKLDTKTAKAGDQVVLKTSEKIKTADGMVIPKGSRLIGHITEVQAHSKQAAESRLGLAFDRLEMRGGPSLAIHSTIESISPGANAIADASMAEEEAIAAPMAGAAIGAGAVGGGRIGSGLVGGAAGGPTMATSRVGSGIGSTAGSAVRATGDVGGHAAGGLGRGVNGAVGGAGSTGTHASGIPGVMLNGDATGAASGQLTAANRNIHLDSGTQMVLGIAAAR
jgi:hypothetical protein